jgi:acyl-coenzyme A thioesterase PaaI-like protein
VTTLTGRVTVRGTVLSKGWRTALADARMTDSHDRLLAYATSSCLLFSLTS